MCVLLGPYHDSVDIMERARQYAGSSDSELREVMQNSRDHEAWIMAKEEMDERFRKRSQATMISLNRQVTILTYIIGILTATNLAFVLFQVLRK